MIERIKKVREKMTAVGLAGFLVSSPTNSFYLSGFEKPEGCFRALELLVLPEELYCFTNALYLTAVENHLKLKFPEERIKIREISVQKNLGDLILAVCRQKGIKNLGFEADDLRLSEFLRIRSKLENKRPRGQSRAPLGSIKLVGSDSIFNDLRKIKEEEEVENIKIAAGIADQAFSYLLTLIKPDLAESDLAAEIDYFLRKNGAEGPAFETIVAGGAGSSVPHHKTSRRKIRKGEIILLDFGARYKGYCSDMTRMVFIGQPNKEQKKVYQAVLAAQKEALDKIRPGMTGGAADKIARDSLKNHRLQGFFSHALGHGLGLKIHEPPRLGPGEAEKLRPGMVFSVEPSVYFPGKFGIRIEDTVILRKGGLEVLSQAPKDLICL